MAELNAASAACIARWRIRVDQNEALGRFLVSDTGVPAGETVMVLPPNLIQTFEEVRDYNTVIQVRVASAGATRGVRSTGGRRRACRLACALQVRYSEHQSERLYSASLTSDDLDNFRSHRHGSRARAQAVR